jgi:hypothetical protein
MTIYANLLTEALETLEYEYLSDWASDNGYSRYSGIWKNDDGDIFYDEDLTELIISEANSQR